MLPLEFLFLSVRPLIDMRLECKSGGKDYPPGVPPHVSRVLELEVVCPCSILLVFLFKTFKKNDNKLLSVTYTMDIIKTDLIVMFSKYHHNMEIFLYF